MKKQKFYDVDMTASIYIRGSFVHSFAETSDCRIYVPIQDENSFGELLILVNWEVINKLQLCTSTRILLRKDVLLPGFNGDAFPFVLDYDNYQDSGYNKINHKSSTFSLLNIKTG